MSLFNEMDFRLSVVKRWAVVTTIRQQSVAEHSFNVALLAERIARQWYAVNTPADLYYLVRYALNHDAYEAMTSDIPSYMKRYVMVNDAEIGFADMFENTEVGLDTRYAELFRAIVKMADFIDAAIFLRMEISHGNLTVRSLLRDLESRFKLYLDAVVVNNVSVGKGVYLLYEADIVEGMFNANGQFSTEGFRF